MAYRYTSSSTETATLELLLATYPALLSRSEIQREIGSRTSVDDALKRFEALGLVHVLEDRDKAGAGDFLWATRTAMAAEEVCTAQPTEGDRE